MCFKWGLKEENRNPNIGISNEYMNVVYLLKSTVIIVTKNCTFCKNKDGEDLDNTTIIPDHKLIRIQYLREKICKQADDQTISY